MKSASLAVHPSEGKASNWNSEVQHQFDAFLSQWGLILLTNSHLSLQNTAIFTWYLPASLGLPHVQCIWSLITLICFDLWYLNIFGKKWQDAVLWDCGEWLSCSDVFACWRRSTFPCIRVWERGWKLKTPGFFHQGTLLSPARRISSESLQQFVECEGRVWHQV